MFGPVRLASQTRFLGWGGMVAPFIGDGLLEEGHVQVSMVTFGVMCFAASIAASFLRVETTGVSLSDTPAGDVATVETGRQYGSFSVGVGSPTRGAPGAVHAPAKPGRATSGGFSALVSVEDSS